MTKQLSADVIVVGAGTAGSYFSWQMAKAGYKVLMLEAHKLEKLGKHIEIFHMDKVRFDEFNIPHPKPGELLHVEEVGYNWSPDRTIKQPVHYTIYVMHMPAFIQRLHGYAREAGCEILEKADVQDVIIEKGQLTGVTGKLDGDSFEARAKLVVDATGLAAAVRTRLPDGFGVENQPVPPDDCFFVCLEFREDIPEGYPTGSNSYMVYKAFWNKSYGDGAILGIGQPHSFEHAWNLHRQWREEYFGDPGTVLKRRQGIIPYHRPPFSMVGNGFLAIGDAANQNKPFSGEGVTSGFTACRIAAQVADDALRKGDFRAEILWAYNVRYFRGQGAMFASGLAQLPAVVGLSPADIDYLFRQNIIFSSADFEELNLNYEIRMGTGKLIKTALGLLWGVMTGQFSFQSMKQFMAFSSKAGKLKAHYLLYPDTPVQFPAWRENAAKLWGED